MHCSVLRLVNMRILFHIILFRQSFSLWYSYGKLFFQVQHLLISKIKPHIFEKQNLFQEQAQQDTLNKCHDLHIIFWLTVHHLPLVEE